MARMVRKQVYIEPEHDALLKRKARELGVTESDLIRRGIEQIARTAPPVPRDARAWDEELAFMRQRGRLPVPAGKRRWTREELYDERLQRISGRH
jgi:hypothetical protein